MSTLNFNFPSTGLTVTAGTLTWSAPENDGLRGTLAVLVGAASPAICKVPTLPDLMSIVRMRWLLVSATYSFPAAYEMPAGSSNVPAASSLPGLPVPTKVLTSPDSGPTVLILLLYVSATYNVSSAYTTPKACCRRATSRPPSTSPKVNNL